MKKIIEKVKSNFNFVKFIEVCKKPPYYSYLFFIFFLFAFIFSLFLTQFQFTDRLNLILVYTVPVILIFWCIERIFSYFDFGRSILTVVFSAFLLFVIFFAIDALNNQRVNNNGAFLSFERPKNQIITISDSKSLNSQEQLNVFTKISNSDLDMNLYSGDFKYFLEANYNFSDEKPEIDFYKIQTLNNLETSFIAHNLNLPRFLLGEKPNYNLDLNFDSTNNFSINSNNSKLNLSLNDSKINFLDISGHKSDIQIKHADNNRLKSMDLTLSESEFRCESILGIRNESINWSFEKTKVDCVIEEYEEQSQIVINISNSEINLEIKSPVRIEYTLEENSKLLINNKEISQTSGASISENLQSAERNILLIISAKTSQINLKTDKQL